jgi:hypothetical protein
MIRDEDIGKPSSIYQIRVQGRLEARWSDWFNNFTILNDGDQTVLTGPVADQAALRGLLNKVWDLNLILVSLERVETNFPQPRIKF